MPAIRPILLTLLLMLPLPVAAALSFDTIDETDREKIRAEIEQMEVPPRISVLLPTHNTPLPMLRSAALSEEESVALLKHLCEQHTILGESLEARDAKEDYDYLGGWAAVLKEHTKLEIDLEPEVET